MYSWVVHFLSYFISIFRERRRERESRGDSSNWTFLFFYFFNVNSFLCTVFTIIIIKCKVSFSSHSSSSHYSMQGFIFIIISSFWGGFIVNINKLYDFEMWACFLFPFQNECVHAEGTCWSRLFLAHFTTLFRMVTKISIKQILFPWLIQAREIKVIPEPPSAVFSVCQNCYQKLVSCWHVFWQIHKFQIHKLVSRHDHLNISTMYSVFDWKEF